MRTEGDGTGGGGGGGREARRRPPTSGGRPPLTSRIQSRPDGGRAVPLGPVGCRRRSTSNRSSKTVRPIRCTAMDTCPWAYGMRINCRPRPRPPPNHGARAGIARMPWSSAASSNGSARRCAREHALAGTRAARPPKCRSRCHARIVRRVTPLHALSCTPWPALASARPLVPGVARFLARSLARSPCTALLCPGAGWWCSLSRSPVPHLLDAVCVRDDVDAACAHMVDRSLCDREAGIVRRRPRMPSRPPHRCRRRRRRDAPSRMPSRVRAVMRHVRQRQRRQKQRPARRRRRHAKLLLGVASSRCLNLARQSATASAVQQCPLMRTQASTCPFEGPYRASACGTRGRTSRSSSQVPLRLPSEALRNPPLTSSRRLLELFCACELAMAMTTRLP